MQVHIAPGCITCGVCEEICPAVFTVHSDTAVADVMAVPGNEEGCRQAARMCPVDVIKVAE